MSGIFRREPDGLVFAHLSLGEYYTARALVRDPATLRRITGRSDAQQIIIFACGLMDDVAPIVEAAVQRGQLLLAAKCISLGRTRSDQLVEYVVRAFAKEVGDHFVQLIASSLQPPLAVANSGAVTASEEHDALLSAWDQFSAPGLKSHQKGRLFEEFAMRFFNTFFQTVYHNLHTHSGELDLVLEITRLDPFWMAFGSDVFVECKNLLSSAPLKEGGAFTTKLMQANIKLGFFISVSGFTPDAVRSFETTSANALMPLIVPITGEEVKRMLLQRENFEDFFKRKVREMKLLRKY